MTTSRAWKRFARELQAARQCAYSSALDELRGLPEGTDWREYIERVKQLPDSLRLRPKAERKAY